MVRDQGDTVASGDAIAFLDGERCDRSPDPGPGKQFMDRLDGGDHSLLIINHPQAYGLLCRETHVQAGVQHGNNSSYGHNGDGGRNAGHGLAPDRSMVLTYILALSKLASMDIKVMQTNACAAAAFLKILANDWRLMILCELLKGERSVGELEEIVSLSQSALSQHLARLRRSHLVKTRRKSQTIYYSIADPGVTKVIGALYDLYCGPTNGR